MGILSSHLETKEERLNRISPSQYNSPDGLFDLAIHGRPHEKSLFDSEDIEVRLDAVRTVFAGLTAISTSWCLAAAGGHILKQQGVKLPKIIGLASVFLAFVAYLGMFANYTYNPTNVRLLGAFTLFVASYVLHSTATGDYHPFADGCCILGIQNIAMLLWASLSFHGTSR
eukprot:TRINITY_DN713_c0_g1_i3.p1 TRINITY_DN713_c0_g1~~TRINITY_DN713_c0_g1_i3.p1  ORF type:complete len:171 (-),score=22.22 TRINITY_DN713_c0_g1_i3:559-1071(-)